jgi:hypothetical protein
MCIVQNLSLIDSWLWFCLFLNYLYLVALLNLKVSYAFMFCYSMKDKLKTTLLCFSIWFETHKWLLMHYFSWSFVCVTFHVITWLLSSMVRIVSFMPIFRVLWSQLAMLYIDLIKIVLAPQKLYCFYRLPTRGRAGTKLGDVDTSITYLYFFMILC